jgi:putative alpha-1,2-mannosidase
VPHDVDGMVELMGGRFKVIDDLKSFFERTPEHMLWNEYYNHANEPVHLVPFLFNRLGEPSLTQYWTRRICAAAYTNRVEGIVGNEDVGQMSAWYVLAAAGIHPACPGKPSFDITSPVFSRIDIALDPAFTGGADKFTIIAHDNSAENVYIQRATLNGKAFDGYEIGYSDIVQGGTLELWMGHAPPDKRSKR